jgi:hypothetical protein
VLISVDEIQAADTSDLTLLAAALQGLNTPGRAGHVRRHCLPQTFEVLINAGAAQRLEAVK